MQVREIPLTNPHGLHARASARVVHLASRFRSSVSLVVGGRRASARNIVGVMMLAAAMGSTVRLEVEGPDEDAAASALVDLFGDGLESRA